MSRAVLLWIAILLTFVGGYLTWTGLKNIQHGPSARPAELDQAESGAITVEDPDYVPPQGNVLTTFQFVDQFERPFGLDDLKDKVWIGSFFFADCPSLCVMQNQKIAKIQQQFQDRGLHIVSISVQPDKDPPNKLWQYGVKFGADYNVWHFLTGKPVDYVNAVAVDIFKLPAEAKTHGEPIHTSQCALFDRRGNLRGAYQVTKDPEYLQLVALIDKVLSEEDAAADEPPVEVPSTVSTPDSADAP